MGGDCPSFISNTLVISSRYEISTHAFTRMTQHLECEQIWVNNKSRVGFDTILEFG